MNGKINDILKVGYGQKRSYIVRVSPSFKEEINEMKRFMLETRNIRISDWDATELMGRKYKKYKKNEEIWGF